MDRTNETSTGYSYGGQSYKKESRTDSQGNTYTVDIPVSNVIPVSSLSSQTPTLKFPQPSAPVDYNQQTIGITSPYMEASQMQNDLAKQQSEVSDIQALQRTLSGKSAFEAEQNQATGLNTASEDYIKKQAELSALNKQAASAQQENIAQGRQLGSVASFVAGQGNEIERNRAIRALTIGAELDALQGNIAVAQMKVKNAVDAKYAGIEQDIKNRLQMFDLNSKVMQNRSEAEQKAWERAKYAVEKQEKKVAEEKKNFEDIQNMIIEATPNAPATVVANAKKLAESGASKLAVAQALGEYAGDYWGTKLKIAQINKTEAEIQKARADAAKTRAEIAAAGGVGSTKSVDTQTQAKFLLDTIAEASNLSGASGRSKARRGAEAYTVGATDYTNLESKVRTIKNNLLTLATDPNIKKFFGPQMTDTDVKNMLAAATTLDTEGQTPDNLREELTRVQGIFQKFAPGYTPAVTVKQDAPSWASSIKSALLNPAQGGTYGYIDNKKQ